MRIQSGGRATTLLLPHCRTFRTIFDGKVFLQKKVRMYVIIKQYEKTAIKKYILSAKVSHDDIKIYIRIK
jgi:hypothetical protein